MVSGIFKLYNSVLGVPLPDIIDELHQRRCVIDWGDFYIQARTNGMDAGSIRRLVITALHDSTHMKGAVGNAEAFFDAMEASGRQSVSMVS